MTALAKSPHFISATNSIDTSTGALVTSFKHRGLPPQQASGVWNRPQDQPLDDRVERPAWSWLAEVALHEPHLGQAALPGPQRLIRSA